MGQSNNARIGNQNTAAPNVPRRRGRPAGGGNSPEQTREIMLEAAERSITTRGYRASTMEVIARDAGYSRAAIYLQFPNREALDDALIFRVSQRHILAIVQRNQDGAGPVELITEGLTIVASELAQDPLLKTISEASNDGTVAQLLAKSAAVPQLIEPLLASMLTGDNGEQFRPGITAVDLGQFLVTTALSFLLGVVPGSQDPAVARRYVEAFVLPAIVNEPPSPGPVFLVGDAR